jgi:uncharacterized protein
LAITDSALRARYGEYALVTGASSGIGAEFAVQLAAAGLSLVIVARRKDRLDALADQLRGAHGVSVEVIQLDLAVEGAVPELVRRTEDLDVGLVVANAGELTTGPFLDNDWVAESDLLQVDLRVPAEMAHVYGAKLVRRGRGALIFLSSAVALAPMPYAANYGATKAYIAALGESLTYELKGSGVDVLTLAPGKTKTEGADNAPGIDFDKIPGRPMMPEPVVKAALSGLGHKSLVIPGAPNKIQYLIGKYLTPRRGQTALSGILTGRALDESPVRGRNGRSKQWT